MSRHSLGHTSLPRQPALPSSRPVCGVCRRPHASACAFYAPGGGGGGGQGHVPPQVLLTGIRFSFLPAPLGQGATTGLVSQCVVRVTCPCGAGDTQAAPRGLGSRTSEQRWRSEATARGPEGGDVELEGRPGNQPLGGQTARPTRYPEARPLPEILVKSSDQKASWTDSQQLCLSEQKPGNNCPLRGTQGDAAPAGHCPCQAMTSTARHFPSGGPPTPPASRHPQGEPRSQRGRGLGSRHTGVKGRQG